MAKSKTRNKTTDPLDKKLYNINMRIFAENNLHDGTVHHVTVDDIKNAINDISNRYTGFKNYAYITHDKDLDAVSSPKPLHWHIVLKFNSTGIRKKYIIEYAAFKYGYTVECDSYNASIQYLVHQNDLDKYQYDKSEIITNYKQEELDIFLTTVDGKLAKASQTNAIDSILEDIANMTIRRFNFSEYISVEMYARNKSLIDNAFKYRDMLYLQDSNRKLDVWFVSGDSGNGKTTIAKRLAEKNYNGVCISSSSNDPMQDYLDQDVLILDDLRHTDFSFQDLLKVLDNHTKSSVKSRYNNKIFMGKLIIITSYVDLEQWYPGVPSEAKAQLYRRISRYIRVDNDTVNFYTVNKDGSKEKFLQFKNPVKEILKQEKRREIKHKQEIALQVIDSFIDVLDDETSHDLYNSVMIDEDIDNGCGDDSIDDKPF